MDKYRTVKDGLPGHVTLVTVSKTRSNEEIMTLYDEGERIFGENKVQELQRKNDELPKDIQWHLIGHLQSNKVKYIAPFVTMIHSVESLKLAKEISKRAIQNERTIDCLLQFDISGDENKFGMTIDDARTLLNEELQGIQWRGVMGMASFVDDEGTLREQFRKLSGIKQELSDQMHQDPSFDTISMGMSNDYKIAIEEGATMVRIGSTIFGPRNYQ